MSSKKAVLFSETKMEEWVYKSPVKNSRNGLNLFIDASPTNQSSVKVQFPKCRCPFGIQEKKADATEFSRRNLELSADDEAMQKWVAAFDVHPWAQFSLKYILANPAVTCVISGTSIPKHLIDNLSAGYGRLPDPDQTQRMEAVIRGLM